VQGALLHLADGVEAAAAARLLAEREGLDGTRGIVQVDLGGDRLVLSASLPRNLTERDMVPTALARRAVESASHGPRNGVAYLRGAVGAGVRTPLTDAYAASVLELVGASSLADAERLVALERPAAAGGANGLG
jgi:porphobilinogen deaminase